MQLQSALTLPEIAVSAKAVRTIVPDWLGFYEHIIASFSGIYHYAAICRTTVYVVIILA